MKERLFTFLQDKDFYELFQKGGISFLIRIGGQITGFLLTVIIAHFFGARGLGDYVLAIIVLRVFTLIAKLGLDVSSIRFIAEYASQKQWNSLEKYRKKTIMILLISTVLASTVMFFSADSIANLIGAKPFYIRLNSFFIFPMVMFILNYQSLRGLKKIAEYSFFFWMSRTLFSAIIIYILVQFSKEADIPIFAFLSSLLFVSILTQFTFVYKLKKEKIQQKEIQQIKTVFNIKDMLLISLPLLLAQSGQFIMAWSDKLMLGGLTSPSDVGVYDFVFKLSLFMNLALAAVTSITAPKFAEMYSQKDFKRLEKVVRQSTKLIFWTSIPLFCILFCAAYFIFSGVISESFLEFKVGIYALLILCFARIVSALSGPAGNLLQMTGHQVIYMKVLFLGAIINILLNYFLIPEGNPLSEFGIVGINGAAAASFCSIVFWNLTMVYFVKKEFGFLTIYIPFFTK